MKMVREFFDLPEDKDAWITSYKWRGLKMTGVPLVSENNVTFILDIKNSISQFQLDKKHSKSEVWTAIHVRWWVAKILVKST